MVRISNANILNFDNYRKEELLDVLPGGNKSVSNGGRAQPSQKKTVKDGVDIMQMDSEKEPS
jgi:hypothetical protein